MRTVFDIFERYCLERELRPETVKFYRRTLGVLCGWHGRIVLTDEFTPELASRFLRDKQEAGRSSYYRKSLRSGLRALLNFVGRSERLRTVRLEDIEPLAWTEEEFRRLLAEIEKLPEACRAWWRTLALAAWYTGLSQADLHRLDRTHITPGGVIRFRRSKTSKAVVVWIPPLLVAEIARLRSAGPIWKLPYSEEMFRRRFKKMVRAARLQGSFKTLRKSSGTAVEELHPGRGHEHLGNTRRVFERHYLGRRDERQPLHPPEIDFGDVG